MSTDLYLFVETRDLGTGAWELATDAPRKQDQNYCEFAVLGDVRNRERLFVPIAPQRGLPVDMSAQLRVVAGNEYSEDREEEWEQLRMAARARYGASCIGEHSHSWLTLEELLAYNWNQRTNLSGTVGPNQFAEFLETGAPRTHSGGVSGSSVRYISNEEMERFVRGGLASQPDEFHAHCHGVMNQWHLYTELTWSVSYKEVCRDLHARFIPELTRYAQAHRLSPDDVRVVIGFSS